MGALRWIHAGIRFSANCALPMDCADSSPAGLAGSFTTEVFNLESPNKLHSQLYSQAEC